MLEAGGPFLHNFFRHFAVCIPASVAGDRPPEVIPKIQESIDHVLDTFAMYEHDAHAWILYTWRAHHQAKADWTHPITQRIGLHQPNIAVECLVVKIFD